MRTFLVVAWSIVSVIVHAAIDSDKMTSLPGYAAGNLPSTHYSGCKLSEVYLSYWTISCILTYQPLYHLSTRFYRYPDWYSKWCTWSVALLVNRVNKWCSERPYRAMVEWWTWFVLIDWIVNWEWTDSYERRVADQWDWWCSSDLPQSLLMVYHE